MVLTCSLAGAINQLSEPELRKEALKQLPQITGPTDDPPPQPALAVAEWEPMTGVLITYPLDIPMHLVVEMSQDVEVMTLVPDEAWMQTALHDYILAGVDTSNCTFTFTGGFTWSDTRDFGPWYIFNGDDELGIICNLFFTSTMTRVPQMVGDTLGIPVYGTGLFLEGGNYMTDGLGMALTTDYTYYQNPTFAPEEIDQIFQDYLGIDRLITTPDPFDDIVPHIDTHAKFLDPGRILVIQPDPPNRILEANVEYWATLMNSYGRPYEIIRVPGYGYSNSLFLNDKVLVALSGDPGDSLAMEMWQEVMPGYEVMGFYDPTFWILGALHCRTHEMADRYMLRIMHIPLHDRENDGNDYCVEANVHAYSNEPLFGSPLIYWKMEGGNYNTVAMMHVSGDDYVGYIPQQPCGTDIYYFLHADDESGRSENHPYIGSGNPHHFYVGPDTEPPMVEFNPPDAIYDCEWPFTFKAYVLDNRWISSVTLEYLINGFPQDPVEMPLVEPFAVYYSAATSGEVQAGDFIDVRVKAVDTSVNQNTTYSPYYTVVVESGLEVAGAQMQNRVSPNPFNPLTTIQFTLPEALRMNLSVYDISGRKVVELVNGWREEGVHMVTFDASNLASGVYVYQIRADQFIVSGKMVLMK
jgi:agmatine/peptidylarginine deiminase